MSEEIKEEKSKAGAIIAVVIAIAVIAGGIMFFKSNKANTTVQNKETAVVTKTEPKEETTTARIDITTKLADADKPQFEVYVDGAETPLKQVDWMPKFDRQGFIVQKEGNEAKIRIKALTESEIKVVILGPDRRDENNKLLESWVDYTSVSVDGKEILAEPIAVWHNKSFTHIINAKNGKEYEIIAKWKKHTEK